MKKNDFWYILEAKRPKYWSPSTSYLIYIYLNPTMEHSNLIHSNIIRGNYVRPSDTIVDTTFLYIWVHKSQWPTPISFNPNSYYLLVLRNICEYFLYWVVPSNKAVFDLKVCGKKMHPDISNIGYISFLKLLAYTCHLLLNR